MQKRPRLTEARVNLTEARVKKLPGPTGETNQKFHWDEQLPGFGLRVTAGGARSFVVQAPVGRGSLPRKDKGGVPRRRPTKRLTIGSVRLLDLDEARQRARRMLLELHDGKDPIQEEKREQAQGIALADAIELHRERLRAKSASPRTLKDLDYYIPHYLKGWLQRPLISLTKSECVEQHKTITREAGPVAANHVFRSVRAVINTALKQTELVMMNPVISVEFNQERRVQSPIPWEAFPAWKVRIDTLNPIRRDLLMTIALTGIRSADAATLRWENLDLGPRPTAFFPNPKGGKERAFYIPLAEPLAAILRARRDANPHDLPGDDGGLVFPTRGRDDGAVKPISEKRWVPRDRKGRGPRGQSPHRLRDTYIAACHECGISLTDLKALVNHRDPTASEGVTQGYLKLRVEYLRPLAEKVAEFLLRKITF